MPSEIIDLIVGGGLVGAVVLVSWAVRQALEAFLVERIVTRIMPATVLVLALAAASLEGGGAIAVVQRAAVIAVAAMGAYSGVKAAIGRS